MYAPPPHRPWRLTDSLQPGRQMAVHDTSVVSLRELVPTLASAVAYPRGYAERCAAALDLALSSVPAYRAWRARDPGPVASALVRLAQMPILTKADLRALGPQSLAPAGRDVLLGLSRGDITLAQTSGSTGDRVTNVWYQPWWDASERASWSLNACARESGLGSHREAILTSAYCVGVPCEDGYLGTDARRLDRFLYLNERADPTEWTAEHMDRMVAEINAFAPVILEANPSFLARLARHAAARGLAVCQPRLIVLTYENPSRLHVRSIRRVFDAPIASSYGSTEAGYVLMECEHGRLHQITDSCHIDFLPLAEEHGGPGIGRILVTTLANPWRSLVRFDQGDLVRLDGGQSCPCGRGTGLTFSSVEGRTVNLTLSADGRLVTQAQVDRALSGVADLVEYQLVQHAPARHELRYVAEPGRDGAVVRDAVEALRPLYGAASIEARQVPAVRPDPPGKYRLTRALFPIDADAYLDPRYLPRREDQR